MLRSSPFFCRLNQTYGTLRTIAFIHLLLIGTLSLAQDQTTSEVLSDPCWLRNLNDAWGTEEMPDGFSAFVKTEGRHGSPDRGGGYIDHGSITTVITTPGIEGLQFHANVLIQRVTIDHREKTYKTWWKRIDQFTTSNLGGDAQSGLHKTEKIEISSVRHSLAGGVSWPLQFQEDQTQYITKVVVLLEIRDLICPRRIGRAACIDFRPLEVPEGYRQQNAPQQQLALGGTIDWTKQPFEGKMDAPNLFDRFAAPRPILVSCMKEDNVLMDPIRLDEPKEEPKEEEIHGPLAITQSLAHQWVVIRSKNRMKVVRFEDDRDFFFIIAKSLGFKRFGLSPNMLIVEFKDGSRIIEKNGLPANMVLPGKENDIIEIEVRGNSFKYIVRESQDVPEERGVFRPVPNEQGFNNRPLFDQVEDLGRADRQHRGWQVMEIKDEGFRQFMREWGDMVRNGRNRDEIEARELQPEHNNRPIPRRPLMMREDQNRGIHKSISGISNPVSSRDSHQWPGDQVIRVYTLLGQSMGIFHSKASVYTLPKGTYVLRISDSKGLLDSQIISIY